MISGASFALFITVFIASAVEAVEAVTIILAAGIAHDWKSARRGSLVGLLLLTILIALFGPTISRIPINDLRTIVGFLLITFGMQWLRKAILRASGHKALHDEDKIFAKEIEEVRRVGTDWFAFTLAFKGVLLEGLEVVFIVITFGSIQRDIGLASIAALIATALAVILGFALHKPLSRVPENSMKFTVGVLLTSFGIFWGSEGMGARWPGDNWSILAIIFFTLFASMGAIAWMKGQRKAPTTADAPASSRKASRLHSFLSFWWEFIVGEDWLVALLVLIGFLLVLASKSWIVIPCAIAIALPWTLKRALIL
jgi:uncharacterized membrane protein